MDLGLTGFIHPVLEAVGKPVRIAGTSSLQGCCQYIHARNPLEEQDAPSSLHMLRFLDCDTIISQSVKLRG